LTTISAINCAANDDISSKGKGSPYLVRVLNPDLILVEAVTPSGDIVVNQAVGCDLYARPVFTFPAKEHHRSLPGTKLYCLVTLTEAHVGEQINNSAFAT